MPGSAEFQLPDELPVSAAEACLAHGFEIAGVVSPATYDDLAPTTLRSAAQLPEVRAVLVLGAGKAFLQKAGTEGANPPDSHSPHPIDSHTEPHPIDSHTEIGVGQIVTALEEAGHRSVPVWGHQPAPDGFLDLVGLGRAAGLGWSSRLGLLLHPERGPWWSLRAAVLTTCQLAPDSPLAGAGPCEGCPAPCLAACPGSAPQESGFDLEACAKVRRAEEPCGVHCAARSGCVVGQAHAYSAKTQAVLMRNTREALLEAAGLAE